MYSLKLIYYSPTGTSRKIVREIAAKLNVNTVTEYDITMVKGEVNEEIVGTQLVIIGVPVYGGRVPIVAVEKLKKLRANNAPVVLVAVYGNRAYEDALVELRDIANGCGFTTIAAAAFIGEHSYSTHDKPIAQGRPDAQDVIKCGEFAKQISAKWGEVQKTDRMPMLEIPGNFPYKERSKPAVLIAPVTSIAECNICGVCVDLCPTNAISIENGILLTKSELCTWCCSCIKRCPNEARVFDNATICAIQNRLFTMCVDRKEPEFFV